MYLLCILQIGEELMNLYGGSLFVPLTNGWGDESKGKFCLLFDEISIYHFKLFRKRQRIQLPILIHLIPVLTRISLLMFDFIDVGLDTFYSYKSAHTERPEPIFHHENGPICFKLPNYFEHSCVLAVDYMLHEYVELDVHCPGCHHLTLLNLGFLFDDSLLSKHL